MPVSEQTYQQVALEDPSGHWELVCGRLRSKPPMTVEHYDTMARLTRQLILQVDERRFSVRMEGPRLRVAGGTYFVPDVCVVPREFVERKRREAPRRLEVYAEPMPLVVEVWSPSTGEYDIAEKLREYQRRGDAEIWRLHPYEKTLMRWLRQPDGSYEERAQRDGAVQPALLADVRIDLAALFG